MAQHDYVLDNQGFGAMRSDLNLALAAIASGNSGNTAPSTVYPGLAWLDTSGTPWLVKQYNGTQWVTLYSINATTHQSDIVRGGTDSKLTSTTALASILNLQAITYAAATAITAAATTDITNTTDNIDLAGSAVTVTAITAPAALIGRRIRVRVTGSNITVTNGGGITVPNGVSASFNAGDVFTLVITAANTVRIEGVVPASIQFSQIQPITASNAANAITISTPALSLDFRNPTLTNGAVTRVNGTPANLTIAGTDSFGLVTAAGNQRIAILALNNAGTIELAASALAGGVSLDETGVISTVTAATAGTHIKSAAARTNVAYRVIGFVDATFTTGTGWGSLTVVQGQGGQALTAMATIGYGQTWQNVVGSRAFNTNYYNTTGRPIQVNVSAGVANGGVTLVINGITVASITTVTGYSNTELMSGIVPPGGSYSVVPSGSSPIFGAWAELR